MITSTKPLGVTCVICFTSSLVVTPNLAAQSRMGSMQTMAMPRPPAMQSMPGQTMAGQMMPGQMMSPGINPNLGFGNLNGFGSPQTPFAGQFGSPLWNPTGPYGLGGYAGGIYGLG